MNLLCPRLTSATSSPRLATTVASRQSCRPPRVMRSHLHAYARRIYSQSFSVQVSDFEDNCLLIQLDCLICDFCSSGQRFACGFLQIPPRDGHPCRPANDSPCRVRRRLSLPSKSALPGAQRKAPSISSAPFGSLLCPSFRPTRLADGLELKVFYAALIAMLRFAPCSASRNTGSPALRAHFALLQLRQTINFNDRILPLENNRGRMRSMAQKS